MKCYLFPGQGSQFKGMGEALFAEFPELTELADSLLGYSIKDLCVNDPNQVLHKTQYTQPALYVVNALSYRHQLKQTGITPDFVAGHSLGEYNALESSGALSFADGLTLVKKRGELMSQAPKGAMAAVLGSNEHDIQAILKKHGLTGIDIANYNSPSQTILSGLEHDIAEAQACFDDGQIRFIPLNTSGAFHSRYMEAAMLDFSAYLPSVNFASLTIPVIANFNALPYPQQSIAELLAKQINHSVRWMDSILYLLHQGVTDFTEIGPGNVLSKLIPSIKEYHASTQAVTPQTPTKALSATDMIAAWNQRYPIGTKVNVAGYNEPLTTKTEAMLLFGHRAAIYLSGYNGYFALAEVTPIHA